MPNANTSTCVHCNRTIVLDPTDGWIDPEAPLDTDDSMWRETCDCNHDEFAAGHEPVPSPEDEGEYVGELARHTTLIDAIGWDGVEFDTEENEFLLLVIPDNGQGAGFGVSDYTAEHFEIYLYGDIQDREGDYTNVTVNIGKVWTDSPEEAGRRIRYYLNSVPAQEDITHALNNRGR